MLSAVPQWGREVASASFCPKRSWAGFDVPSWGKSTVHDRGSSRCQGSIPHDGRWSLLWTWQQETRRVNIQKCWRESRCKSSKMQNCIRPSTCVLTQQPVAVSWPSCVLSSLATQTGSRWLHIHKTHGATAWWTGSQFKIKKGIWGKTDWHSAADPFVCARLYIWFQLWRSWPACRMRWYLDRSL